MADKNSGNKPKKSKNDLFRTTVGFYLKQKCYVGSDKFRKSDFLLLQNKQQFMVQKMLEVDLHGGNCFAYSNVLCITNNQHIVDQQFGRFSQFVEAQPENIRTELRRFYAPMLCHLYIELVKAREQKAAGELLRKYAQLVAPVETYDAPLPTKINGCSVANDVQHNADSNAVTTNATVHHINIRFARSEGSSEDAELAYFTKLIQTLCACTKLETAESDAEVAHFRSSKYEIHTTEAVVEALLNYLEKRGHVLILNLLYTWMHVVIIDNEVQKWTEDSLFLGAAGADDDDDEVIEDMQVDVKPKVSTGEGRAGVKRAADEPLMDTAIKTENAMEGKDESKKGRVQQVSACLQGLLECREEVQKSHSQTPRFIKITEKSRGLTSAHIDANECHLIAGFNNSVVQLWQMNQHTCSGRNLYRRFPETQCSWELNNCGALDEGAEAQIEADVKAHERGSRDESSDRRRRKFEEGKYPDNSYNEFAGIQLRGHGLGVTDVRFSSHYPLIFSASKDSTVRSWRAESYSCASIYRGHRYPIWCMDESPVGMYIATGSKDLTARLWSLERDFPFITYAGHTQDVECLAFHPNGNYLATGSADLSVRLWCVTSGKLMRVFSECKQPVTSLAFSPDGKMLAAGGEETKIRIFDIAAGSQLSELKEHSASVTSIAWSGHSRHLASACRDGSLRLWDVKKLTPINENSSSNSINSSSSSSSSSSTTANRVLALSSNCQRLVKVLFSHNEDTICGIGS